MARSFPDPNRPWLTGWYVQPGKRIRAPWSDDTEQDKKYWCRPSHDFLTRTRASNRYRQMLQTSWECDWCAQLNTMWHQWCWKCGDGRSNNSFLKIGREGWNYEVSPEIIMQQGMPGGPEPRPFDEAVAKRVPRNRGLRGQQRRRWTCTTEFRPRTVYEVVNDAGDMVHDPELKAKVLQDQLDARDPHSNRSRRRDAERVDEAPAPQQNRAATAAPPGAQSAAGGLMAPRAKEAAGWRGGSRGPKAVSWATPVATSQQDEGEQHQEGAAQPSQRQLPKVSLKPGPGKGVAAPPTALFPAKEEWQEAPPTQEMVDEVRASAETLRQTGVSQTTIDKVLAEATAMEEEMGRARPAEVRLSNLLKELKRVQLQMLWAGENLAAGLEHVRQLRMEEQGLRQKIIQEEREVPAAVPVVERAQQVESLAKAARSVLAYLEERALDTDEGPPAATDFLKAVKGLARQAKDLVQTARNEVPEGDGSETESVASSRARSRSACTRSGEEPSSAGPSGHTEESAEGQNWQEESKEKPVKRTRKGDTDGDLTMQEGPAEGRRNRSPQGRRWRQRRRRRRRGNRRRRSWRGTTRMSSTRRTRATPRTPRRRAGRICATSAGAEAPTRRRRSQRRGAPQGRWRRRAQARPAAARRLLRCPEARPRRRWTGWGARRRVRVRSSRH